MSGYVSIDNLYAGLSQVADFITSFLSMSIPQVGGSSLSSRTSVCVLEGLTARSKVQLAALVPACVGVAMAGFVGAVSLHQRCHRRRQQHASRQATHHGYENAESEATPVFQVHTVYGSESSPLVSEATDAHHSNAASMSVRSRLIAAAVNFGLTAYSAFVAIVVQLLHCVSVPGARESRLFIQGSVVCDLRGWQAGYVVALCLLSLVPFALPIVTHWSLREGSMLSQPSKDARIGVARALCSAYAPTHASWECVLMLHRLALALLYTFANSIPAIQTSLCALVTICALALHVFCAPMRGSASQPFQTTLLLCLLIVTVSKDFESSVLELASATSSDRATAYFAVLTLVFGYVVPLAGAAFCYWRVLKRAAVGACRKLACRAV